MKLAKQLGKLGTETAFAVSAAATEWAGQGHKVYPFHLGDMNIPTPANVIEATQKAIADGFTGYCPGGGIPELREAVARDVGGKRQLQFSLENVSIQPGGKPVIGKFLSAVMNPGDKVLYPNPGYPIYESQIEYQGGEAVPYGYIETEGGFELDIDAIRHSITQNTRALIYNNFQNPNGAQSSRQEMEQLAKLAIKNDLWVLSDEAYFEIQYGGTPQSIVSIPGMLERSVILYTCSKRFAMTGWRLGAAIGPPAVIDVINKLNTNIESCTTHFIQKGMVEAIEGDTSGPDAIIEILRQRRDAAVAGLNAMNGISIQAPNSTFYLFPNITEVMNRKGMKDVNQLMDGSLRETDVSFCTRNHFGRPMAGEENFYIRFAYSGIDVDDIKAGMARLKEYFDSP
ncbi:MAG: aminotransferase class I/II-fold pyridoxal phosphate-dependent enzyme [Pseudomonadales bacterium]|jgi:aspartate/methionine/tyrosine aminotransferase|nr:aspartate aminotransferase [Gammaproteobacteria bacterium]MDP6025255.1 aminotransferase class I/II-fold pyridoxal phosphate-dependent enzyme [Pseudomonadales bacterium]MDP6315302.1 aminotransferase class I/II-fold pyridoxal phosphate-dependent enzyme [Pseudomonadales bacterium]MDP7314750.1 aminotransferase class I/II-fold pyridoxal phosphate-dependent enzyme [Pseudomonadales bacterium]MDP7576622.1 aminotransferase class I/II-fold pyridoxal phosphate-dependent enzyme [Pseudomonadales bacteriu|tara:strand:- start:4804 stop:6000 length:1197 start_codon:yes stop_codon:yes gene_type:complete